MSELRSIMSLAEMYVQKSGEIYEVNDPFDASFANAAWCGWWMTSSRIFDSFSLERCDPELWVSFHPAGLSNGYHRRIGT